VVRGELPFAQRAPSRWGIAMIAKAMIVAAAAAFLFSSSNYAAAQAHSGLNARIERKCRGMLRIKGILHSSAQYNAEFSKCLDNPEVYK
jgi:hypothetical protein